MPETAMTPPPDEPDAAAAAESPESRPIRRILVALDASAHSHDVLMAALSLAARLRSEVQGLFVEDVNLLRLAELPFAREIRYGEPARAVESSDLQRRLRARATVLRHELQQLAEEHSIPNSFRVARGVVEGELLAAALEADMLALGRLGHTVSRRARLGSAARAAVARATSAVLLVKAGVEEGPAVVIYDGSPRAESALHIAAQLAGTSIELRVLVWGEADETAAARRAEAISALADSPCRLQFQHLSSDEPERLAAWVARQHGSLLILPTAESLLPPGTIDRLLDDAEQHILLLR